MIDAALTGANWFDAFCQPGMSCTAESHLLGLGETRIAVYRTAERIATARGERFVLVSEIAARLGIAEAAVLEAGDELRQAGFFEKLSRLGSSEARGYRAVSHEEWALRYLDRCWKWEARVA